MKLLVGLGNPGNTYCNTRHNYGFMAIDFLREKLAGATSTWQNKFNGQFINISNPELGSISLLKPQTFMNLSGQSVIQCMNFYKIPLSNLYVFHDDLDIALGKVKIKTGGGNGGHNGLKSIDSMMGNSYHRLRLGIGRPPLNANVSNFVLGNFTTEEKEKVNLVLTSLEANLNLILSLKFDKAMSHITAKTL
jgi:PTH1 family peptidyl-tRNA hydrolase